MLRKRENRAKLTLLCGQGFEKRGSRFDSLCNDEFMGVFPCNTHVFVSNKELYQRKRWGAAILCLMYP